MSRNCIFIILLVLLSIQFGCKQGQPTASQSVTGIVGRVYSVGGPAVSNPPPVYEKECTIIVVDSTKGSNSEFKTNGQGEFQIELSSGIYYLQVKESVVQDMTGPFVVVEGKVDSAFSYYNNGLK